MTHGSLKVLCLIALVTLTTLQPAHSHVGDRLYTIIQLTKDMVERIDIQDGTVDEWMELEPSLSLSDFGLIGSQSDISTRDPSDLDFRIWLGWTPPPSRIYVAAIVADDIYKNDYDPEDPSGDTMLANDAISVIIDADHSGGPTFPVDNSNAQWYHALSQAPGNVNLEIFPIGKRGWPVNPPFGDGGGSVQGENPTIAVTEFYVTPFERFDYEDQLGSARYELTPGTIVGFHFLLVDRDSGGDEAQYALPFDSPGLIVESLSSADIYVDGFLVGIQDESVVEPSSWARIKASLWE